MKLCFQQAGTLVTQVRKMYGQPAFQRSLPTIVAIMVVIFGLDSILGAATDKTTFYAGLPEAEKSRVIDALKNSGVDVSLDPVTGDVLVPNGSYHSSRMTLAAQGLPLRQAVMNNWTLFKWDLADQSKC